MFVEEREYEICPLGKIDKYFERIIKILILKKICTIKIRSDNQLCDNVSDYKSLFN